MELYYKNSGDRTVNIDGVAVRFRNSIATVGEEFGVSALKLGIPNLFENGKQPAFATPKEFQLKADFADREAFYQKELGRLTNINECNKKKISELEQESKLWKHEFEKETIKFREFVKQSSGGAITSSEEVMEAFIPEEAYVTPVVTEQLQTPVAEVTEPTDEEIISELRNMTKNEIIGFATENGIDVSSIKNETKDKMVEFVINSLK